MRRVILTAVMVLTLASCARDGGLRPPVDRTDGPDEFAVLPTRPLDIPQNLAALPAPTPGGTNLTDANPKGDAIVALGGRPGAAGGIPVPEAGLVNSVNRNGVSPDIRATLSAEDAKFRRNRGRFTLFGRGYYRAYDKQSLDPYEQLLLYRNAGVQVPSAPPDN